MPPPTHITPSRGNFVFGVVFVLIFSAMIWWRTSTSSGPDIPREQLAAFAGNLTLEQAIERAGSTNKPVLVYATATWCGPCRGFKASTLSRSDVSDAILASFEPVYLDFDTSQSDIRTLRVTAVPTIMVLRDGEQVDRHVGAMSTDTFMAFLDRNANLAEETPPAPAPEPSSPG